MQKTKEQEMQERINELVDELNEAGFNDVRINTRYFFDTPYHYFCVTHNRTVIIDEISDGSLAHYGAKAVTRTIKNMWLKRTGKEW